MNKSIIFILVAIYFCSFELFAQSSYDAKYDLPPDSEKALHMPFTNEAVTFMRSVSGGKGCYVKVYSYDGVPYSGGRWTGNGVADSASYWDLESIRHIREKMKEGMRFSTLIWIEDSTISMRGLNPVNMYVINPLTGDTVISHYFAKPKTRMQALKMPKNMTERVKRILEKPGYDFSTEYITMELPDEVLHYEYSLPKGLYFAYFVDAENEVLCWAEQINKK